MPNRFITKNKSSYEKGLDIERWSEDIFIKYITKQGFKIERLVNINENDDYKMCGDYKVSINDKSYSIELKCEEKTSINIFAEIWSNKSIGRQGWLYTCEAEILCYLFKDTGTLIKVKMSELKEYCIKNLEKFREVEQKKYTQTNNTIGLLVPIKELRNNLKSFKEDILNGI